MEINFQAPVTFIRNCATAITETRIGSWIGNRVTQLDEKISPLFKSCFEAVASSRPGIFISRNISVLKGKINLNHPLAKVAAGVVAASVLLLAYRKLTTRAEVKPENKNIGSDSNYVKNLEEANSKLTEKNSKLKDALTSANELADKLSKKLDVIKVKYEIEISDSDSDDTLISLNSGSDNDNSSDEKTVEEKELPNTNNNNNFMNLIIENEKSVEIRKTEILELKKEVAHNEELVKRMCEASLVKDEKIAAIVLDLSGQISSLKDENKSLNKELEALKQKHETGTNNNNSIVELSVEEIVEENKTNENILIENKKENEIILVESKKEHEQIVEEKSVNNSNNTVREIFEEVENELFSDSL